MKRLFMVIALAAMGMTLVPQVQAQTQQQQQELEQIARRSVNGLSPQDRRRTIQIMTDVFVAQGMSRQQAASLAEMSADSMFTSDVGEMSAEERRMFEEQNRAIEHFEGTDERARQAQEQERRQREEQANYPGNVRGWPAASLFQKQGVPALRQPAATNASYTDADWGRLTVYLTGGNADTVVRELVRQIEAATGRKMDHEGGWYRVEHKPAGAPIWQNFPTFLVKKQENGTVELSVYTPAA
jgi:hypothetical protein